MRTGPAGRRNARVVVIVTVKAAPLYWRISPVQTAVLILIAVPCAFVNLYLHPSIMLRVFTLIVGVVALVMAYASIRMYLVVDDEGVAVRWLGREQWLPWSEVERMDVVSGVRGADTIRFHRKDGTKVDVPPSLLQPSKPTARPAAHRRLLEALRQIEARQPGNR